MRTSLKLVLLSSSYGRGACENPHCYLPSKRWYPQRGSMDLVVKGWAAGAVGQPMIHPGYDKVYTHAFNVDHLAGRECGP